MKLALIGYGKMGRLIEQVALERGYEVVFKVDVDENSQGEALTEANLRGVEVAIDFTMPQAVVRSAERITGLGINMVVGTTGWLSQLEAVRRMVEERGVGFVYGSNFSIGVNVFFRLMEAAATLFSSTATTTPGFMKSTTAPSSMRPPERL